MTRRSFLGGVWAGGLTSDRLLKAMVRRVTAVPHAIEYSRRSGPGTANHEGLKALSSRHAGERCFILGNGPSLRRVDLTRLAGETSFGLNRIYLMFESTHFRPTYFVCMNELVIEQSSEAIGRLGMPKFINWRMRGQFKDDSGILYLREVYWPRFSTELTRGIWGGATVTYAALQVAYYMGFAKVVLIGVDHRYSTGGTPHQETVSTGADVNHFSPEYFPKGFRWQLPDLATAEYAYRLARDAFEAAGRQVLDATEGGQLQVFTKVHIEEVLG